VTINALLGLSSINASKLLEYGSRVPQAAAAVHLPIFDAGRLKARYGATQAAIDSAVASYQDTVVSAARDVATQASTRAQIAAQRNRIFLLAAESDHALRDSAERLGIGLGSE
jgi:multidrug efflux system outer membrane protein